MGTKGAIVVPPPISTLSAKGVPPLGKYFSGLLKREVLLGSAKKPVEPIAAPKGTNHGPQAFSPAKGQLPQGTTTGATMPIADPPGRHPLRG
jgi:hypothetical protein